jgi:hypothetical protein
LFTVIVWLVIIDMLRVALRAARGLPMRASSEAPHVARLAAAGGSQS